MGWEGPAITTRAFVTNRQLKKAELHFEAAKQAEAQLRQRAEQLQAEVSEGEAAARERQRRQEDIREEAETLRKGLCMQVRGRTG